MIKKVSVRCISVLLGITLFTNNIFGMSPKIDEAALIAKFCDQYYGTRKSKKGTSKGANGFCANPSDKFMKHDVVSLYYIQPGGTYKGETRDVYVWNLPGVVDTESFGICSILINCLKNASQRLDSGSAVRMIEHGKKLKFLAKEVLDKGGIVVDIIKEGAAAFGFTPEVLINAFKRSMEIFRIKNPKQMAESLCKCTNEFISSGEIKTSSGIFKFAPYIPHVIFVVLHAFGVYFVSQGYAAVNEDARNIADTETIIITFFNLIVDEKYLGSNIVVMAKDNTSIPWYDPFRHGKMPFIGFWCHNGIEKYGAPIFDVRWLSSDAAPMWAITFVKDSAKQLSKEDSPLSMWKALKDAKESLNSVKKSLSDTAKLCSVLSDNSDHLIEWVK